MYRAQLAAALTLLAAAPRANAAGPDPLAHDLRIDLPVTLVLTGSWVGSELAKGRLAPAACRLCEPNPLDAAVRGAVVWERPAAARHASDALAFAVLPAAMVAHQLLAARDAGELGEGLVDVLLVAEATALAASLNQLVKFNVGRERPFVHYGDPARPHEPDDDLSFYSGHTSLAFSLAASAGMVSTLRGYRSAPWVWGTGMTLAATVGWLRMGGDKHWFTDVLVGAVVGTAVGAGIPWLLHRDRDADSGQPADAAPAGIAFAFAF